jgi:hypothetical protein
MTTQKLPLQKAFTPIIEVNASSTSGDKGLGLDRYIAQCYEMPEGFEITGALNTAPYHRFDVKALDPNDPMYPFDLKEAQQAISQKGCDIWNIGSLLNKMASDGFLQPGVYLIDVSW